MTIQRTGYNIVNNKANMTLINIDRIFNFMALMKCQAVL